MAIVCVLIAIVNHAITVGSTSTRPGVYLEIAGKTGEMELWLT